MAALDASIVLIALPAIFRGINLDPLQPANIGYLLWMLMGYLVVTAVLVVTFGRLGDIFGRVRMYNAGFAVFSFASLALSLCPLKGGHGALWLIAWRVVQGIGGALLMSNSTAILTDAFPVEERGMAMGINMVAAIAGSFIGLVLGGVLAAVDWRAVFWVNVPIGVFGTVWAYLKLRETGMTTKARIDWWGNLTFAVGLVMILIGLTYGLLPHGHHNMGWTGPWVLFELADRYGARPFATGGMLVAAASFIALSLLPANFKFGVFGSLLLLNGVGMGLFAAPNTTGIMNSLPAGQRGAGSGMRATFMNTGMVLSIGIFFSLMIFGLSASLPKSMSSSLQANGVAPAKAAQVAKLPPVGSLFSAFLGYNPMEKLLGSPAKAGVNDAQWSVITGKKFFPNLISGPFMKGLRITLGASFVMSLIAALASWLRGAKYVHDDAGGGGGGGAGDGGSGSPLAPPGRSGR